MKKLALEKENLKLDKEIKGVALDLEAPKPNLDFDLKKKKNQTL